MSIKIPDSGNAHIFRPRGRVNRAVGVSTSGGQGALTPKLLVFPEIEGDVMAGERLTITVFPVWEATPTSEGYIWQKNFEDILGTEGANFHDIVGTPEIGDTYRLRAFAENPSGTASRFSNILYRVEIAPILEGVPSGLIFVDGEDPFTLDLSGYQISGDPITTVTWSGAGTVNGTVITFDDSIGLNSGTWTASNGAEPNPPQQGSLDVTVVVSAPILEGVPTSLDFTEGQGTFSINLADYQVGGGPITSVTWSGAGSVSGTIIIFDGALGANNGTWTASNGTDPDATGAINVTVNIAPPVLTNVPSFLQFTDGEEPFTIDLSGYQTGGGPITSVTWSGAGTVSGTTITFEDALGPNNGSWTASNGVEPDAAGDLNVTVSVSAPIIEGVPTTLDFTQGQEPFTLDIADYQVGGSPITGVTWSGAGSVAGTVITFDTTPGSQNGSWTAFNGALPNPGGSIAVNVESVAPVLNVPDTFDFTVDVNNPHEINLADYQVGGNPITLITWDGQGSVSGTTIIIDNAEGVYSGQWQAGNGNAPAASGTLTATVSLAIVPPILEGVPTGLTFTEGEEPFTINLAPYQTSGNAITSVTWSGEGTVDGTIITFDTAVGPNNGTWTASNGAVPDATGSLDVTVESSAPQMNVPTTFAFEFDVDVPHEINLADYQVGGEPITLITWDGEGSVSGTTITINNVGGEYFGNWLAGNGFTPNAGGSFTATVNQTLEAPVITTPPTLSTEAPQVGFQMEAFPGTMTGEPDPEYAFTWSGNGAQSGVNNEFYTPNAADIGNVITATQTATNGVAPPDTAIVTTDNTTLPAVPVWAVQPTISPLNSTGGDTLTMTQGTASDTTSYAPALFNVDGANKLGELQGSNPWTWDSEITDDGVVEWRVNAINAAATVPSDLISGTITEVPDTVPAQMDPPTLAVNSDTQITATFASDPDDGGSPITSYDLQHSTDNATWTVEIGEVSPYAITGLTGGTLYYVQTRAVNAIGNGAWSTSAQDTTEVTPVLPNAPTSLVATGGDSLVDLAWVAPVDTGTQPITGYFIERETPVGNGFTTLVANTGTTGVTYQDATAVNDTQYNYRISAITAVGTGPVSNEDSATPIEVPPVGELPVTDGLVAHFESDTGLSVTNWEDQSVNSNGLAKYSSGITTLGTTPSGQTSLITDTAVGMRHTNPEGLPFANTSRTLFAVWKYIGGGADYASGATYGQPSGGQAYGVGTTLASDPYYLVVGWSSADRVSTELSVGAWVVQHSTHDSADNANRHYLDGAEIDAWTASYSTGSTRMAVGMAMDGGRYAGQETAAYLIYDRVLTAQEQTDVVNYLNSKYLTPVAVQFSPQVVGSPTSDNLTPKVGETGTAIPADVTSDPPSSRSWLWNGAGSPVDQQSYTYVEADVGTVSTVTQIETNSEGTVERVSTTISKVSYTSAQYDAHLVSLVSGTIVESVTYDFGLSKTTVGTDGDAARAARAQLVDEHDVIILDGDV